MNTDSSHTLVYSKSPLKFLEDLGLEIRSSVGRAYLNNLPFLKDAEALTREYQQTAQTISILHETENNKAVNHVMHQLSEVQDIHGTLTNLKQYSTLNDIELFEIKHFALIVEDLRQYDIISNLVELPDTMDAVDVLDPEKERIDTFFIYDSYSPLLAEIRKKMKATEEIDAELFHQAMEIEDGIREDLSEKLMPHAENLILALDQLAYLDVLFAKAILANKLGLTQPTILIDSDATSDYKGIFHPQIKALLKEQGKEYQPINVDIPNAPTLITGINMGGKTVILRTLALAQYMCQFGFFVPAVSAQIALVDDIMMCIDDDQNHLQGLSSFAAEMKNINMVLNALNEGKRPLVLIDELARTTNPTEGSAIVSAVLEIFREQNVRAFVTSHYDHIKASCRRKRVKGLTNLQDIDANHIERHIDYSLVDDAAGEVPHEALRIAELLGTNPTLIQRANTFLNE